MNAAICQAQDTLPLFLTHALTAESDGVPGSPLKVGLPAEGGQNALEHIWVSHFLRRADRSFVALLANEPVDLGVLRTGDPVKFSQSQISDRNFASPGGLLFGNYTSHELFERGAFGAPPSTKCLPPPRSRLTGGDGDARKKCGIAEFSPCGPPRHRLNQPHRNGAGVAQG